MATPLSSRAIPYAFNGAQFRNAIQFVFEMAADPVLADQILFHFEDVVTNTSHADGDRVPFDPRMAPTVTTHAPVRVPCDVEFTAGSDVPTEFGTIIPAKLTVLLLDVDYEQVKDAAYVTMNGDRYNRLFEQPSFGLFDVGLHTLVFQAENEI